jgi:hypothetical protein
MALFNLGSKSTTPAQAPKSELELLLERAAKVGMGHEVALVAKEEITSKEYLQLAEEKAEIWKQNDASLERSKANVARVHQIMEDATAGGYSPELQNKKYEDVTEGLNQLFEYMTGFGL